jgi:hypothetical protein
MIERIVTDNEIIERELSQEEITERQELNAFYRAQAEAEEAEAKAKADAKAAIAARLGLSADDLATLLG